MRCLGFAACLLALAWGSPARAATLYADAQLKADLTDGTYSVRQRAPGGSDGNAYRTIQAAVEVMEPGDTLLLRGGVFREHSIRLFRKSTFQRLRGTPERWFTVRSYPGEWAVVDGEHHEEVDPRTGGVQVFSVFLTPSRPGNEVAYWRFSHFEVTGGGPALNGPDGTPRTYNDIQPIGGKGFDFIRARHLVFDHLSVHGNYGGGGPNGGAGIHIQNSEGSAQHIVVQFCHLRDNGWPGSDNLNLRNVVFYADYRQQNFPNIPLDEAMSENEVRYCLLEDSANGFNHKSTQFLCLDPAAADMRAQARGDQFHHNIVCNCSVGIHPQQDFAQVHHNVLVGCRAALITGDPSDMFHVVLYNNTVLGARSGLTLGRWVANRPGRSYEPPFHPHTRAWNNVVVDANPTVHSEAAPVRVLFSYNRPLAIDMKTVDVDHLLLLARTPEQPAIHVANQSFSPAQYLEKGWSKAIWALPTLEGRPFFQGTEGAAAFELRTDLVLQEAAGGRPALTPANAGRGGDHPYLPGVKIPAYLGALNPAKDSGARWNAADPDPDDAGWAQYVLGLEGLGKTIQAPGE